MKSNVDSPEYENGYGHLQNMMTFLAIYNYTNVLLHDKKKYNFL
jgi:hypothetical protein